jgi:Fanconi anemia group J protein
VKCTGRNAQKLSRHPSLQTGGSYEVHDIEDLLRVGKQVKGLSICLVTWSSLESRGTCECSHLFYWHLFFWLSAGCPYFAAQTLAEAAQLVFCPYNYLISPIVRRAMDIDIRGSVVILDEAQ